MKQIKKNKPTSKPFSKINSDNGSLNIRFKPFGYSLLGSGGGQDGIRYLWKIDEKTYLDCAKFNCRVSKDPSDEDKNISAHTTSVSLGCYLKLINKECKFCATGKMPFKGILTPQEIAFQNIFMVKSDIDCESHSHVKLHKREFAYMGQGEPGFSYPQIKEAIKITDIAMSSLDQQIHRHLISTVGIPELINAIANDIKNNEFQSKITLHFSLHLVNNREILMPINKIYSFQDVIRSTEKLFSVTNEKISISILMFDHLKLSNSSKSFHTDSNGINSILKKLNKDIHRITLCELNTFNNITNKDIPVHRQRDLLEEIKNKGFEGKLFASFGKDRNAGCGLLQSFKENNTNLAGEGMNRNYLETVELIKTISRKIG
jgi:adenine C2-methylase RlmN of 23S rRNA A2503 and tRNA A37